MSINDNGYILHIRYIYIIKTKRTKGKMKLKIKN